MQKRAIKRTGVMEKVELGGPHSETSSMTHAQMMDMCGFKLIPGLLNAS